MDFQVVLEKGGHNMVPSQVGPDDDDDDEEDNKIIRQGQFSKGKKI